MGAIVHTQKEGALIEQLYQAPATVGAFPTTQCKTFGLTIINVGSCLFTENEFVLFGRQVIFIIKVFLFEKVISCRRERAF